MKKLIGLGLICLFFSACSTNTPETPQAAGFVFSANPASGQVSVVAAPSGGFAAQATIGERTLEPGQELELSSFDFAFLPGNVLVINAVFKNVSSLTFENLRFSRTSGTSNIVGSSEPGAGITLAPGEATGALRFEVVHRGQAFSYKVEAEADVVEPGGAECSDPVSILDNVLERAVRKELQKPSGGLTCDDLASLTELNATERDEVFEQVIPFQSLEGLQFAINLTTLSFRIATRPEPDLLLPLRGLISLERLTIGSNREFSDEDLDNIDLSPLSGLTNLTYLLLPETQFDDLSPLAGLTSLTELIAADGNVTDFSPLSDLVNLVSLDLSYEGSLEPPERITALGFLEELTALDELNLSNNLVTDLGPLVANPGIGEGDDRIDLSSNCLDLIPGSGDLVDIATLENRNPDVQNIILGFQKDLRTSCGETPSGSAADLGLFVNAFVRDGDDFFSTRTIQVDDAIELVVNIDNNGPDTAFDLVVTVEVDNAARLEQSVLEDIDVDANCDTFLGAPNTYKLVCTLTELASASRSFLTLTAEPAQVGIMTAQFKVSSDTTIDLYPFDNSDLVEITVLP